MPTARLRGIELHYEERGSGPPLLLVPGIPAIASDWAPLAERLSGSRRAIAYDNRGSGRLHRHAAAVHNRRAGSRRPRAAGRARDRARRRVRHVARRDDRPGAGARLAGRVDRLVLGCTHCGLAHAAPPEREAGLAFAMETDDWAERMRALAPFAFAPGVDGELLRPFIEKKSADVQDPDGYRGQIAAVLAHDTYERLPQIRRPTLVLTGESDRVIPAASSNVLHERIPDSRLEVVGGAGHLFFLERPEESLRLLEEFHGR